MTATEAAADRQRKRDEAHAAALTVAKQEAELVAARRAAEVAAEAAAGSAAGAAASAEAGALSGASPPRPPAGALELEEVGLGAFESRGRHS